ncbi:AraC family transcriptional regulator [Hyphococcus flavus]|uniref:AraC family transcriptional regulator n=1 Tax=Hyphococcus flavus TaxID=1866326 RepID=A0AAE9ZCS1_9PROT|nr:AraC family transcriptional regulator [Hyphococcus flavus]WDI31115.1 AraC family transcriptional regulator [Hyphococcus flavus]
MDQVLLSIGLAITALLGAVVLNRRHARPENIFLAGWLIAYAAAFFGWIAAIMIGGAAALVFSAVASSGLMATPALSWLYARALSGETPRRVWLHFLPSAANFVLIAMLGLLSAAQNVNGAVIISGPSVLGLLLLLPSLVILAMSGYAVAAWKLAASKKAALKATRSDDAVAAFDWVRVWSATTLALLTAFLIFNIAVNAGAVSLSTYLTIVFAMITAQIIFVVYHGLKENVLLGAIKDAPSPASAVAAPPEQVTRLASYMEETKPHLDPGLTIDMLADGIGWDRADVTAAIRQSDANFFDYVNRWRVAEAKALLTAPENGAISVLAIGFDSGFGSKSAFNAAFKKATGETPSQFRQQHRSHKPL